MSGTGMRLGELLMEARFIDQRQLEWALEQQRLRGGKLGKILVDSGLINEQVLLHALSRQTNLQTVDLDTLVVDPSVVAMVPKETATQYGVVPVDVQSSPNGNYLILALRDPATLPMLNVVQQQIGMYVQPVLASDTAVSRAIRRYYFQAPARPAMQSGSPWAETQPAMAPTPQPVPTQPFWPAAAPAQPQQNPGWAAAPQQPAPAQPGSPWDSSGSVVTIAPPTAAVPESDLPVWARDEPMELVQAHEFIGMAAQQAGGQPMASSPEPPQEGGLELEPVGAWSQSDVVPGIAPPGTAAAGIAPAMSPWDAAVPSTPIPPQPAPAMGYQNPYPSAAQGGAPVMGPWDNPAPPAVAQPWDAVVAAPPDPWSVGGPAVSPASPVSPPLAPVLGSLSPDDDDVPAVTGSPVVGGTPLDDGPWSSFPGAPSNPQGMATGAGPDAWAEAAVPFQAVESSPAFSMPALSKAEPVLPGYGPALGPVDIPGAGTEPSLGTGPWSPEPVMPTPQMPMEPDVSGLETQRLPSLEPSQAPVSPDMSWMQDQTPVDTGPAIMGEMDWSSAALPPVPEPPVASRSRIAPMLDEPTLVTDVSPEEVLDAPAIDPIVSVPRGTAGSFAEPGIAVPGASMRGGEPTLAAPAMDKLEDGWFPSQPDPSLLVTEIPPGRATPEPPPALAAPAASIEPVATTGLPGPAMGFLEVEEISDMPDPGAAVAPAPQDAWDAAVPVGGTGEPSLGAATGEVRAALEEPTVIDDLELEPVEPAPAAPAGSEDFSFRTFFARGSSVDVLPGSGVPDVVGIAPHPEKPPTVGPPADRPPPGQATVANLAAVMVSAMDGMLAPRRPVEPVLSLSLHDAPVALGGRQPIQPVVVIPPAAKPPVGEPAVAVPPAANAPVVEPVVALPLAANAPVVEPVVALPPAANAPVVEPALAAPPAVSTPAVEPAVAVPPAVSTPAVEPAVAVPPAVSTPAVVEPAVAVPPAANAPVVEPALTEPSAAKVPAVEPAVSVPPSEQPVPTEDAVLELTQLGEEALAELSLEPAPSLGGDDWAMAAGGLPDPGPSPVAAALDTGPQSIEPQDTVPGVEPASALAVQVTPPAALEPSWESAAADTPPTPQEAADPAAVSSPPVVPQSVGPSEPEVAVTAPDAVQPTPEPVAPALDVMQPPPPAAEAFSNTDSWEIFAPEATDPAIVQPPPPVSVANDLPAATSPEPSAPPEPVAAPPVTDQLAGLPAVEDTSAAIEVVSMEDQAWGGLVEPGAGESASPVSPVAPPAAAPVMAEEVVPAPEAPKAPSVPSGTAAVGDESEIETGAVAETPTEMAAVPVETLEPEVETGLVEEMVSTEASAVDVPSQPAAAAPVVAATVEEVAPAVDASTPTLDLGMDWANSAGPVVEELFTSPTETAAKDALPVVAEPAAPRGEAEAAPSAPPPSPDDVVTSPGMPQTLIAQALEQEDVTASVPVPAPVAKEVAPPPPEAPVMEDGAWAAEFPVEMTPASPADESSPPAPEPAGTTEPAAVPTVDVGVVAAPPVPETPITSVAEQAQVAPAKDDQPPLEDAEVIEDWTDELPVSEDSRGREGAPTVEAPEAAASLAAAALTDIDVVDVPEVQFEAVEPAVASVTPAEPIPAPATLPGVPPPVVDSTPEPALAVALPAAPQTPPAKALDAPALPLSMPVDSLPPLSSAPGEELPPDPLSQLDGALAALTRLFIRKGLVSEAEVIDAITHPPPPRSKA